MIYSHFLVLENKYKFIILLHITISKLKMGSTALLFKLPDLNTYISDRQLRGTSL